jgi:hypothetical protein
VTKYLVLYRGSATAEEQMANTSPEQAQAGMELWMQWMGNVGAAMVDMGSPLRRVATLGNAAPPSPQSIGGYSILEADSTDAIKNLLEDHPHFHTPGDTSIEVYEYLPIPGT